MFHDTNPQVTREERAQQPQQQCAYDSPIIPQRAQQQRITLIILRRLDGIHHRRKASPKKKKLKNRLRQGKKVMLLPYQEASLLYMRLRYRLRPLPYTRGTVQAQSSKRSTVPIHCPSNVHPRAVMRTAQRSQQGSGCPLSTARKRL